MLESSTALSKAVSKPQRETDSSLPGLTFLGIPRGGPSVLLVSLALQPSRRAVRMLLRKAGAQSLQLPPQAWFWAWWAPGRREKDGKEVTRMWFHPDFVLAPYGALSKFLPSLAPVSSTLQRWGWVDEL